MFNIEKKELITIIVPCYNEAKVLEIFYKELDKVTKEIINYDCEILFVDDGSKDNTMEVIYMLTKLDNRIRYISFSRNFGKESAMIAGLKNAKGNYVVIMDSDLQHPPKLLHEMIEGVESGYESVATRRKNRKGEPAIRSCFASLFYKIVNKMSKVKIVEAATDYRLMNRKMVNAVLQFSEYHRFTKGIFEWVGFKTKWIEIENNERVAGETTWSFWSLLSYAIEGIVSFTTVPLRIATILGSVVSLTAFAYTVFIIGQTLIIGKDAPGYASLVSIVLFIGGVQLLSIGVIGEYLSRVYMEVKSRPIYIVDNSNLEKDLIIDDK